MDETNIYRDNEFSIICNNINFNLFFVLVIFKKENSKDINMFRPAEFWNNKIDKNYIKYFIIKIEILIYYIKIFLFRLIFFFSIESYIIYCSF
jgi:hypothetical protein